MTARDYLADNPPPSWKVGTFLRFREKLLAGFPPAAASSEKFDSELLRQVETYLLGVLVRPDEEQEGPGTPDIRHNLDKAGPAIHDWLCRFLGQPWSQAKTAQLGCFAASWAELFRAGVPPPVWTGRPPVWALIHVKDLIRLPGRDPNYRLLLDVIGGPAAGLELSKHVPGGVMQNWLRELGGGTYNRTPPGELGGLILTGVLSRDVASGRLMLSEVQANPSILGYNRKILKARKDLCKHPTYRGKPCFNCRLGRSSCPLSRHLDTHPIGFCSNATYFHKGPLIGDWCTSCLEKGFVPEPEKKDRKRDNG